MLTCVCCVNMRVLCCSLVPEEAPKKEYVFKNKKEAIEAFKALLRERVRSLLSPAHLCSSMSYTVKCMPSQNTWFHTDMK